MNEYRKMKQILSTTLPSYSAMPITLLHHTNLYTLCCLTKYRTFLAVTWGPKYVCYAIDGSFEVTFPITFFFLVDSSVSWFRQTKICETDSISMTTVLICFNTHTNHTRTLMMKTDSVSAQWFTVTI